MAPDVVGAVRAVLSVDDGALDYAEAKLAFDRLIDPACPVEETMARLDRMVDEARRLAGPGASPDARITALRRLLYAPGPWNEGRPFAYDHSDPLGQRIGGKLLAGCFKSRRGNCVSMPALFVILADRLGLDVVLVSAPLHVFVRYRTQAGQVINIEAANGGNPSRDEWYRKQMPMSDRAIASGLYLRSLSKREGVALLATTVLEWLIERGRFAEALGVSEIILDHAPRDAYTMVKQAFMCAELIRTEFIERSRSPDHVPPAARARYLMLNARGQAMSDRAEQLGWEPVA